MRKLASIQRIKSLTSIPGADLIEKAQILGWELVVKKDEFQEGDLCVYIEIDSILPEYPIFEFLRPRKFRIRTIKLKNTLSQGIAFPLSVINEIDPSFNISKLKEDDDVTSLLKIRKFETEEEREQLIEKEKQTWLRHFIQKWKWKLFGKKNVKNGDFPTHLVPKTDENRVNTSLQLLAEQEGNIFYITEKCEGSSSTFVFRKGQGNWLARLFKKDYSFLACSRNWIVSSSDKPRNFGHFVSEIARKYNLEVGMKKINRNLAIQGEVVGPKVQGNLYRFPDLKLRVFLMYDLDSKQYLSWTEMVQIAKELNIHLVPLIGKEPLVNSVSHYINMSKGKSILNPKKDREGIVIRSVANGRISFKAINPNYLLKQEDEIA